LLIIRILFRSSFVATTDTAPRADGEHFGFPGVVEDDEGDDVVVDIGGELEGERRGRRAFVGVRRMMEGVRMKDEALMSWIVEMVNAAYDGLPRS
jgi:chromatin structure-remodeling complex subunit RSC9